MSPGLVTLGETMGLIAADGIGPLEYVRGFHFGIAGAESNVAIGVARLGGSAAWLGRIGPDSAGDLIERRLRAEGVHTIAVRDQAFTGLLIRHRRTGGLTHVDYHRAGSAGSRLTPADLPAALLQSARILHVTGITPALSDTARATVFQAVETARAAGVAVSVDVNYRAKLWSRYDAAPVLRDLVSRADVVFAGPDEAALVLGGDDRLADRLAALGPAEVMITDGPRGCTGLIAGERYTVPALDLPVVDPVGAGDAFVAGYLADRLAGAAPAARLATAVAMGGYTVTIPGDCEGLPSRADLAALLGANDDVAR